MNIFLLSFSVWGMGAAGVLRNRRSILMMLVSIEVMLLGVTLLLVGLSIYRDDVLGQVFAMYVLLVAAAESAIGLALLVAYHRVRGNIEVDSATLRHG